jgi:hypothetical protein
VGENGRQDIDERNDCDVRAVTSEIATIAGRLRGQLAARGFPRTCVFRPIVTTQIGAS